MDNLIDMFKRKNIDLTIVKNRDEVFDQLRIETEDSKIIGIGNSQTLKALGISEYFMKQGKTVYDKTLSSSSEEAIELKRRALLSDCYISSSNAVGRDGTIVNVDHSGNRVAAITYGPKKVILIVSMKKLEENEQLAVKRALSIATPRNAIRAKIESPCSKGHACTHCDNTTRVCNFISIIRGQVDPDRLKLILINEDLGF
jgi:hypothetical protein